MKTTRNNLKDIMLLAWSFVRRNGFTMAEAMKTAWRNYKLKNAMHGGIVKFYFLKMDSTLREAYGTLKENLLPATQGTGKENGDALRKQTSCVSLTHRTSNRGCCQPRHPQPQTTNVINNTNKTMKIIANFFYVGQIVFSAALTIWALYMTLRGLFTGGSLFVTFCFAVMTCTTYCLMYVPSVREYKEHKARHNNKTQTEQND